MWHNFFMVYLFKEEKMRKTIITICAFVVLFGFAVSSAMAQTWKWTEPALISNGPFAEFQAYPAFEVLNGCDTSTPPNCTAALFPMTAPGVTNTDTIFTDPEVDSVVAPLGLRYGIDNVTVGLWDGSKYVALDIQPNLPSPDGTFTHIAAGADGSLYVIFEETETPANQHVVVGTPPFTWEFVDVRFTPRSLNLGSNGRWITCKISDLPDLPPGTYESWDEVIDGLCIVAVNDIALDTPICRATEGPSNTKNSSKLMVKFNRKALTDAITAQINDTDLSIDPTSTKITLAFSDGEALNFYGEDIIKTKPAKEKKPKKK
jgi:hypothetical protein